jgi:hypothetical protein
LKADRDDYLVAFFVGECVDVLDHTLGFIVHPSAIHWGGDKSLLGACFGAVSLQFVVRVAATVFGGLTFLVVLVVPYTLRFICISSEKRIYQSDNSASA